MICLPSAKLFSLFHSPFAVILDPNLSYEAFNGKPRRAGCLDCARVELARTTFVFKLFTWYLFVCDGWPDRQ